LERTHKDNPYVAIAYVYISFKDQTTLDLSILYLQMITQLLAAKLDTSILLDSLERCFDSGRVPLQDLLQQALRHVMAGFKQTFFIIDGIDKCPNPQDAASHRAILKGHPRDELLRLINTIRHWDIDRLHFFMASRPLEDVALQLTHMRDYDPIDDAQVEDLLNDLPSDIFDTYDRMLLRMNETRDIKPFVLSHR
jgi:hypothetical protein